MRIRNPFRKEKSLLDLIKEIKFDDEVMGDGFEKFFSLREEQRIDDAERVLKNAFLTYLPKKGYSLQKANSIFEDFCFIIDCGAMMSEPNELGWFRKYVPEKKAKKEMHRQVYALIKNFEKTYLK